jgi:hypothetical protein
MGFRSESACDLWYVYMDSGRGIHASTVQCTDEGDDLSVVLKNRQLAIRKAPRIETVSHIDQHTYISS